MKPENANKWTGFQGDKCYGDVRSFQFDLCTYDIVTFLLAVTNGCHKQL